MQLSNLVKPIDECTNEELLERLRTVRHSREIARPVAKAAAEKAEKKTSRVRVTAMDKLLAGLSDDERAKLIEQLSE